VNDPPTVAPSRAATRIAVIGGGISGLAAAHRLTELLPHARVVLFEASGRLGGVLDTAAVDGFLIERSADNFLTSPDSAIELCRRLGLADQLLHTDETRRRAFVVRKGRLLPVPAGFYLMSPRRLWPFITSPLVSWPGKLRMLTEPLVARGGQADESVASFARRRLGREVYEQLVQPLVAGIYTADPEMLSMAATMPQFFSVERTHGSLLRATLTKPWFNFFRRPQRTGHFSDQLNDRSTDLHNETPFADQATGARYGMFVAPKDGMKSIVQALAARLRADSIQLETTVTNITREADGRWLLDLGSRTEVYKPATTHPQSVAHSGCRDPQSFDAVIIALPSHAAAKALKACNPQLAAELAAIAYAGCAVVSLGFLRRQIGHALDGFGFVVPQVERRRIIAASFASLKFPGRSPHDGVLIRVFVGGALQPELLQLSDSDLSRLALDELTDLLAVTGRPLVTDIARWPASMPQYQVGHLERMARIERLSAQWPNFALAGNAYHGVGIPQCILSGETAAERIATFVDNRFVIA
jgi:oxygen-dependent protoporphyrinogen oxidase